MVDCKSIPGQVCTVVRLLPFLVLVLRFESAEALAPPSLHVQPSMEDGFLWGANGICSWEDYPYIAHQNTKGCQKSLCKRVEGSGVDSFATVTNSDEGLMEALTLQPVSVSIDASFVSRR